MDPVLITAVKPTKKGRYALFCAGDQFLFSVDEETVAEYSLFAGAELSETALRELREKSDFRRARSKAYDLLALRAHSQKELRDKIARRFDAETAEAVTAGIEELGYLDDRSYAADSAAYVFTRRRMSRRAAEQYLREKGIAEEWIAKAMEKDFEGDAARLRALTERQYQKKLLQPNGYRNVFASLVRRGFTAGDIRNVLAEYAGDTPEEE